MKKIYVLGVLIIIICSAAGYLYSAYLDKDTYKSHSQLVVLNPKSINQASDYASIITSRSLLEKVRQRVGLNESVESIQSMVKASIIPNTNMISIEVTTGSAHMSKMIASVAMKEMAVRVKALFGENNTRIVDEASVGMKVAKRSPMMSAILGAGAGVAIAMVLLFIFYDTPKSRKINKTEHTIEDTGADETIDDEHEAMVVIKPVGYKYSGSHIPTDRKHNLRTSRHRGIQ